MKIGIDGRLWSESGIGRYIRNLVENLGEVDTQNSYVLFLLKKNLEVSLPQNFKKVEADIPWYGFAEQLKFPKIVDSQKLDLMHFPHFNIPIFYKGKFIVTIHDLIHQHFKMKRATTLNPLVYQIKHLTYKQVFTQSLKKSRKIITVSDYVKTCLIREMKVDDKKISVTKEAVEDKVINLSKKINEKDIKNILDKFKIRPPFLFYVGNAHPHKNVEGLIKAFLEIRRSYQYLQLVLSGNDHYFWQKIKKEYAQSEIIFTGHVSDEELVALYKSCRAFVMPSFEEGFGIPLLEAMACETAVVSSNKASLPEVGGDAVLYFDPKNQKDMVDKISQVLNSNNLRKDLIEKGEKRYKNFSWRDLATETMQTYQKIDS